MGENNVATCLDKCRAGYTANGNGESKCERCDESCAECEDQGQEGDANKCTKCSAAFGFKYGEYLCLGECN